MAFMNSQSLDQLTVGQAKDTDAMTTLEFDEFKECIARCALDKYKPIKQMSDAVKITSFCKNLLGEDNTEECLNTATLIKAERYNWKRYSQTLPGQSLKEHKKWLEVWQRLELTEVGDHRCEAVQHGLGTLHGAKGRPALHEVRDQAEQGTVRAEPCEGRFGQGHGVHGILGQDEPAIWCVNRGAFADPTDLLEDAVIAPGLVRTGRQHAALLGEFRAVLTGHDHAVVPSGRASGTGESLPRFSEVGHSARRDQGACGIDDGPAGLRVLNRCEQGETLARCGARGMLAHGFDELGVQLFGLTGREEATVVAAGGPGKRQGALG